ncbi:hypothetical protein D9M70_159290 [compost metagenome]
MAAQDAHQHHREDQRPHGHVGTVETGEHEEGGAVDARPQGQPQFLVGVDVLLSLEAQEGHAQQDGQRQPGLERAALVLAQGVVGEGHGEAGRHQQDGVDQRQVPGIDHRLGRREQLGIRVVQQRPGVFEVRPEHVGHTLGTLSAEPGTGPHADVEQRAEEGGEEHHFGEDEPAHAPAEGAVHLPAVEPRAAFADHIAEPAEHHVGDQQAADEEDDRPVGIGAAVLQVVEPGAQPVDRGQQGNGGDDRPLALGRNVILLVTCHRCCSPYRPVSRHSWRLVACGQ